MRHIGAALASPHRYFSELAGSGDVPWLLGIVGFLLAGATHPLQGRTSMLVSSLGALLFALVGCYLGSKLLGGRAKLFQLLGAVGIACIWPSLAAIPASFAVLHYLGDHGLMWPAYITVHVLFVIWFLDLAYEAVRSVNGFGVFRGLLVTAWSAAVSIPIFLALTRYLPQYFPALSP